MPADTSSFNPRPAGLDDLPSAVREAREAQRFWRGQTFKQRAAHVYKIKAFLSEHADEVAKVVAKSTGKTPVDAVATEVLPCIMACDWYAQQASYYLKPSTLPGGSILFANKRTTLQHVPVGVVGIISPWNYPFSIPFGEIIMGLMAGNAVLLKVASNVVPVGEIIERCIAAGDLPRGLFRHVVCPGAKVSAALLENGIDKIFFTGSVQVGKQLMKEASDSLTPLSLELGGNDPMLVLEDADLERAANCAAWAGYQNCGSCGGVERVYVHEAVYDTFLDLLNSKTKALRHGDAQSNEVDIGAMTTENQWKTVQRHVDTAVAAGAKIAAQSTPVGASAVDKPYYPATVLTGVDHTMAVMREETFGPVLAVMRFSSVDEAVDLANDSDLALTSSVFTASGSKGRAIAERLETGMTTINDHLYTHGASETPWGGWKLSGLGRTHGPMGLREMCNAKAINSELLPSSFIPRNMWWYPHGNAVYESLVGSLGFLAPSGVWNFLTSTKTLVVFALGRMLSKWRPKSD